MNLPNVDLTMVMTVAVAFAWVFMLLQWVDFIRQLIAIKPQLLPVDANWGDRAAVLASADLLKDRTIVCVRLRSLLEAWSRGSTHIDIVDLATAQSTRVAGRIRAAMYFSVLLLAGGLMYPVLKSYAALGLGFAGATAFLYFLVLSQIDGFIERSLIDKLPGQIEGLKITADDLAQSLGGAIEKAFKNYIPQPDQLATSVTGAVEVSMKNSAATLDALHKRLLDVQEALATKITTLQKESAAAVEAAQKKQLEINDVVAAKWATGQKDAVASADAAYKKFLDAQQAQQKEAAATLEAAQKRQSEINEALATKWAAGNKETIAGIETAQKKYFEEQQALADKQIANQKEVATSLDAAKKALDAATQQLQASLSGSAEKWQGALLAHSQQVTQASQSIAAQLEKISEVGKAIDKVLHIQETVDNTIKSVTTTEDFKNTLATLKSHLEKSDNLLREVTKPRTIRLVESSPEPKVA